jgi:hypothetical protein
VNLRMNTSPAQLVLASSYCSASADSLHAYGSLPRLRHVLHVAVRCHSLLMPTSCCRCCCCCSLPDA